METAKHPVVSLSSLLWAWAVYKLSQMRVAPAPRHRAEDVNTLVAGGGNPAGV